jgi:hypothetical protein
MAERTLCAEDYKNFDPDDSAAFQNTVFCSPACQTRSLHAEGASNMCGITDGPDGRIQHLFAYDSINAADPKDISLDVAWCGRVLDDVLGSYDDPSGWDPSTAVCDDCRAANPEAVEVLLRTGSDSV